MAKDGFISMLCARQRQRFLRCGGVFAAIDSRKIGAESGAALRLAVHKNKSATLLHDAIHGRKSKPRTLGALGSKERLENARLRFAVHPNARVADGEHDVVAWSKRSMRAREVFVERDVGRLDGQFAALWHGIAPVEGQVHDDLVD